MFPVAPEGRLFVIGTAWLAVITLLFGYTEMGAFLVTLAIAFLLLFRAFARRLPPKAAGFVAPVDGVVQSIEEARDPFSGQAAWRIVIRQRALGEYNLYAPHEGTISQRLWSGTAANDAPPDPQLAGRLAFALENDDQHTFALALDRGRWPRFIRIAAVTGSRLGGGKRFGFAGFGLDAILWLPASTRLSLRPGQRVLAGSDLLGSLPGDQDLDREANA